MEKFQISYEMYDNVRKHEKQTGRPIATSLLLQIGEVSGKWNVMHIISVDKDEYNRYVAHVNILDTYNTKAEAQLRIRAMKGLFSEKYKVKFDNKGNASKT